MQPQHLVHHSISINKSNIANLADLAQQNFVHNQFDSAISRISHNTANFQNSVGQLDLVNLAREILEGTGGGSQVPEETQVRPEMTSAGDLTRSAQSESPTSRFTAVNVKEQSIGPTSGVNGSGMVRKESEERLNGQPRINPPGQEKLTITTSTRDDWVPPPLNNGDRHSYQPPAAYSAGLEGSAKRKRSGSLDQASSSVNPYHGHHLTSSTKQTPTTANTESDEHRQDSLRTPSHPDHREQYGPDVRYRQYAASTEDHRDSGPRNEQWHHGYQQQHNISPDEQQLGDALRQSMDGHQREYISPGDDDRSLYGGYGQDRREMSASSDPKKRKRNFSNRTKTGCMTCRRRKKKCDETRPECMCF